MVQEYRVKELDESIVRIWEIGIQKLRDLGATIVPVSLPHTQYALPAYYILALAEASSNLARFDGMRYGMSPAEHVVYMHLLMDYSMQATQATPQSLIFCMQIPELKDLEQKLSGESWWVPLFSRQGEHLSQLFMLPNQPTHWLPFVLPFLIHIFHWLACAPDCMKNTFCLLRNFVVWCSRISTRCFVCLTPCWMTL